MNAASRYWDSPAPSFQFNLNGSNDSSMLSLSGPPVTNAVSRINPPAAPSQNTDWRLQGFNGSSRQPYNQIQSQPIPPGGLTPVSHAPNATVTSPNAYTTHPDAYNKIVSAPPEHREQYGWGQ